MGYEPNEQPMISAYVYYYDKGNCSSLKFCENLLFAFKKYGYSNITNIELGKHKLVKGILRDYVVRYNKKDLSAIDLSAEVFKWVKDYEISYISFVYKKKCRWLCDVTWYKNYKLPDKTSVSDYTFNHIAITSSYENIENKNAQNAYVGLFCELSDLFEAFYGRIEDVATAVELLDLEKKKVFNHKCVQTVYWGNYLCNDYCLKIGQERLDNSPFCIKKATTRGVFLSVTDNLLDSKNNPNIRLRKKLLKYLTK